MNTPFVIASQYDNYDLFAEETRTWNLRFIQLDRGPFIAKHVQVGLGNILLSNLETNRHMVETGEAPGGFRSFGLPAADTTPYVSYNKSVPLNAINTFSNQHGMDGISFPGFKGFALSFPEDLLDATAHRLGFTYPQNVMRGGNVHMCDPSRVA